MELTMTAKRLKSLLTPFKGVCRGSDIPALMAVDINASRQKVVITATNLPVSIRRATALGDPASSGRCTLMFEPLFRVLQKMPAQTIVTLKSRYPDEDARLVVSNTDTFYSIPHLAAEEVLAFNEPWECFLVRADAYSDGGLNSILEIGSSAAKPDRMRFLKNTVYLCFDGNRNLRVFSTDGAVYTEAQSEEFARPVKTIPLPVDRFRLAMGGMKGSNVVGVWLTERRVGLCGIAGDAKTNTWAIIARKDEETAVGADLSAARRESEALSLCADWCDVAEAFDAVSRVPVAKHSFDSVVLRVTSTESAEFLRRDSESGACGVAPFEVTRVSGKLSIEGMEDEKDRAFPFDRKLLDKIIKTSLSGTPLISISRKGHLQGKMTIKPDSSDGMQVFIALMPLRRQTASVDETLEARTALEA